MLACEIANACTCSFEACTDEHMLHFHLKGGNGVRLVAAHQRYNCDNVLMLIREPFLKVVTCRTAAL